MDRGRLQELMEKRRGAGLTDAEADELGRLMAEDAGEPYANADNPPEDVEVERDAVAAEDKEEEEVAAEQPEEIEEGERTQRDVDESIMDRGRRALHEKDVPPPA